MKALDRKAWRDLWGIRGQALAIAAVIACGVATFTMSLSMLASLRATCDAYYERYRFAEIFARARRAPLSVLERAREIPGLARVEARIVADVVLDLPDMVEAGSGRVISIPERGLSELNRVHLRAGRMVAPGAELEVLVGEGFAKARGLGPGDGVTAVLNGRRRVLRIVGIALSPEYIYAIPEGAILPDDRRFGVFWMGRRAMAAAFDMEGAFNELSATLAPGASEAEAIRRLDRLLAPHGCSGAFARADQPSHKFVSNELDELRGMAVVAPSIFLGVAALLLQVAISRLVGVQREQIAALKAFGYRRRELAAHYAKIVAGIVIPGIVVGEIAGARLGLGLTALYARYFRFPDLRYRLDWDVALAAAGVTALAAAIGVFNAARRALAPPAAEGMRPEPPGLYRVSLLERALPRRWPSPAARMAARNLERRPLRSLFSALGVAMAAAVLVVGNFMMDSINHVMELQFEVARREDVAVAFREPEGPRAVLELASIPGARRAEGFRSVPARLVAGPRSRRVGVTGLEPDGKLYRLIDVEGRPVSLVPGGLVLSRKLGERLEVGPGDVARVEILEGRRPVIDAPIVALIEDFEGMAAHVEVATLNRWLQEGPVRSGAFVAADPEPGALEAIHKRLKESPRVAGVTVKRAALDSFRDTVAENILRMRFFNVLFASVIACGVVYNTVRIAVAERSRDLATLRVIGFTRGEVSAILLGELAVLVAAAVPCGLVLGRGLAELVTRSSYDTELFRIPLVIGRGTYAFAALVVLAAAATAGWLARRELDRLDLVAVLKSND